MNDRQIIVSNAREVWKHWSLWLGGVGTGLVSWLLTAPESAIAAWAMLPDDLKAALPPTLVGYAGVALWGLALAAKFLNQRALIRAKRS